MFLDPPPVVFDGVQAFRKADLFSLQFTHPVDVVSGANDQASAFAWCVSHAQKPGSANVRVHMDRWKQATEADQVVEVVDVVRIPVIFSHGSHKGVFHPDLFKLLFGPA